MRKCSWWDFWCKGRSNQQAMIQEAVDQALVTVVPIVVNKTLEKIGEEETNENKLES